MDKAPLHVVGEATLDAPLGDDACEALDAACRALWGGREWLQRPRRRRRKPDAWMAAIVQSGKAA